MKNLMQRINPANISQAIDASIIAYGSWLCTAIGGQLHQEADVFWTESESGQVNMVLSMNVQQDALPALIARIRQHFAQRKQGFEWQVGPSSRPENAGAILRAHGLKHEEDEPGMAIELETLQEDIPLAANITVLPVTDHTLLEQWVRVWLFPVPEEHVQQIIANYARIPLDSAGPLQFYLGLQDGTPVATVRVFYDGCVAAIHSVVTLPAYRHQGIGTMMTLMAAREARARGYHVAVLTSSPFGLNIYCRLGFREYCVVNTYSWSPEEDRANQGEIVS